MPSAYAGACLPRLFGNVVGGATLNIPHESFLLRVVQYLAKHYSRKIVGMCGRVVIIKMGGNFKSGIAYGIERHTRDIEIEQVGVVTVDYIERAVVEIGAIFHSRHGDTVAPRPLTVNHAVAP